ncbi:hypothetical protein Tsubulata_004405 [Turnera subulata]|uniref:F-box domain-containing protein n=1 Tax=Turnera subulata TaxID=218843 RepID=A0A9Q0J5T0_9ROSI|nr:hypothetical protein Tsubulata_004405 [Turnera subulata]
MSMSMSMSGDTNKRHKSGLQVLCSSSSSDQSSSTPPPPTIQSSISSLFPPPSSDLSDFTVEDYMLVEVFCRLPSIQALVQCMCVCKSWYRIISTHFFVRRFITRRHINMNSNTKEGGDEDNIGLPSISNYHNHNHPLNLIMRCTISPWPDTEPDLSLRCRRRYKYVLSDQYLPFFQKRMGLDFSSYLSVGKKDDDFEIFAASNDLVLCTRNPDIDGVVDLYLCNLLTKQWTALPLPLVRQGCIRIGLVCEPLFVKDTTGGGRQGGAYTLNYQYRYRVVFVVMPLDQRTNLFVDIYSSETGKWSRFPLADVVQRGYGLRCWDNIVTWNGKLHWHSGRDIVAFDPFDPHNTHFIQISPDIWNIPPGVPYFHKSFSVCRGFLRFMKIHYRKPSSCTLMVWELEDSRSGKWSLKHNVNLTSLVKLSKNFFPFGLPCHPTDPNIIYFMDDHDVICCNLQTGDWKSVAKTPHNITTYASVRIFPVVLPPWPTPILPVP